MDAAGNLFGPFDVTIPGSEAEPFTEGAYEAVNGHISGVREGFAVTVAGLTATLTAGLIVSHGFYLDTRERPSPATVTSPATAAGALGRRDLLVARRTLSTGDASSGTPGTVTLVRIAGTPAASPVDPAYDAATDEPIASWLVPSNAGTVASAVKDLRRWLSDVGVSRAEGIVTGGYGEESAATTGTSSGSETRLGGSQNRTAVTLTSGRAYEAVFAGRVQIRNSGGLVKLRLRARKGATPLTSSPVVSGHTARCPTVGSAGQQGVATSGQPFQIAAGTEGSDWQIHLFGESDTGGPGLDVTPDERNIISITVKDVGPAPAGLRTI